MNAKEEIAVAYLLKVRMRERREKRKSQKESVRRAFLERVEKGLFLLFRYFS